MSALFQPLADNYPTQSREDLYKALGGEWPTLVDHPNYQNTCATRLSVAFHGAGYVIPDAYKEGMAGDGRVIIIKVRTMWDYVVSLFGQPTWGMSKEPGTPVNVPVKKGIIVYHKAYSDATGHFDLWKGNGFVGSGDLAQAKGGYDIGLWYWD